MVRFSIITGIVLSTLGFAALPTQAFAIDSYGSLKDYIELAPGRPGYHGNYNIFHKRTIRNPINRDRRLRDVPAVMEFYEGRS